MLLLVVALGVFESGEGTEGAVLLVVSAGGEVEGRGGSCRSAVAEGKRPEASDQDALAVLVAKYIFVCSGDGIEHCYLAAAEVAHQDVVAVSAEVARRLRDRPGRAQECTVLEA